jgi:hypothetical protein
MRPVSCNDLPGELKFCVNDEKKADCIKGWIGNRDDKFPSHGEAMAQLLSIAVSQNWQGKFETEMLVTLCAIVV